MRTPDLYSLTLAIAIAGVTCTKPEPAQSFTADLAAGTFSFRVAEGSRALIGQNVVSCGGCSVRLIDLADGPALEVRTAAEFSDLFVHVAELAGAPLDLTRVRYLTCELRVPEGSRVAAMKVNFRDTAGNFGGIPEIANDFYGRSTWQRVLVDLAAVRPELRVWDGTSSPLPAVAAVSFNPYARDQADSSVYYVRGLAAVNEVPPGYTTALAPRPDSVANVPYAIDFDDPAWVARQSAYRTFEGTYQTLRAGVHGNASVALRIMGKDPDRHIAYLPQIAAMTGHPADFRRVDSLAFRYYLEPGGDPVDGAGLFLASEGWADVLYDSLAVRDFTSGAWSRAAVALDDLHLRRVRGKRPADSTLAAVHELRLDLNYRPNRKRVAMWIDDFVWK